MKKFEVGKTYIECDCRGGNIDVEIRIVRRTEKTVTFIYTKQNWWQQDITKEYRKKIGTENADAEVIHLGDCYGTPVIMAE